MEFNITFYAVVIAIVKLFILMSVGYLLYHYRVIDDKFTDTLSLLLVRVIFPALIISKTITHFSFKEYAFWWVLPVSAIVFSLGGMLMGLAASALGRFPSRKEFMCSCGFQNCGYLPMNLILFAFAGSMADRLLIYVFLFIVGFNILMWSLLPLFLTGRLREGFKISIFMNSPVVATVFSLFWVAAMGRDSMPAVIMDPLRQLGQAAFPVAMLTLGAYLSRYRAHAPENRMAVTSCVGIKLLLFPLVVLAALKFAPLAADLKLFLFLQSIMPTAVSLVVIGSYTDSDNRFFSSSIFYSHVIAIFSIPVWLAVFQAFIG
ncbi:MAG: AEC family transporter [Candidatus Omnitrophota bacterium]